MILQETTVVVTGDILRSTPCERKYQEYLEALLTNGVCNQ